MSVMVLFEAPVKSDAVAKMKSYLAQIFPDTRAYEGCQGIDAYFHTEDGNRMVFVERWDSRAHHQKYVSWRTETGEMDKIGAMLAAAPSIRYFESTEA
jgi:quinol monooxygenase YgiN